MKIRVTDKIIRASKLLMKSNGNIRACHCPLALALNQQTERTWFVARSGDASLGKCRVRAHDWGEDKLCVVLGDKENLFDRRWENGKKIKPFSFSFPDKAGKIW